jgi:hypothetical protein
MSPRSGGITAMGNTLWVNVREGRSIACNQNDHSIMYHLAEELDGISSRLGVRPLTEFYDHTSLEQSLADEFGDADAGEETLGEGTGSDWSVDEASWFDSHEGLATVEALLEHIRGSPGLFRFDNDRPRSHWRGDLIEELEDCRSVLAEASGRGQSFHLSVVM